jgi:retron-type reverse transcriptase
MPRPIFYSALARAMLAGQAAENDLVARASKTLGRNWRWIRPLAGRYLAHFGSELRPRRKEVVQFLRADERLADAQRRYRDQIRIAEWIHEPASMHPVTAAVEWQIPRIESVGALAEWLEIGPSELAWFADLKRLCSRKSAPAVSSIAHYSYRVLAKDSGNIRLIEAPKRRLKQIQQKILSSILDKIPAHPAAHGFVKQRSIKTFAAPHVGHRVVLRMDLKDFFPSIHGARIPAFFRMAGYPEPVADLLGGLCMNATPRSLLKMLGKGIDVERMVEARALYAWPHLPQGGPTSPALANLCGYRMDCRLSGLAQSANAVYTRYADDLAFSGDETFARSVLRFAAQVAAILREEGFTVHHRKTRVMRQGVRQYLAGIVVNEHSNIARRDYDRLKAILTNCFRHGPESQNRESHPAFRQHLKGRVAFVAQVNTARGAKLHKLFEQIEW